MNENETVEIVRLIGASFPNWNLNADTIEVYAIAFSDIDFEVVKKATTNWILSEEFAPTIAGIRKKCAEVMGSKAPLSADAWGEVRNQILSVGMRGNPKFSDDNSTGLIRKTVESIGWGSICMSTSPDIIRAQFLRLYDERKKHVDNKVLTSVGMRPALTESVMEALGMVSSSNELKELE